MIGKKILRLRKKAKLTQEQLAKLLGVTQGAVAQWENGLTHPAFNMLPRLAAALGVTVYELMGREEAS
jgi:transcriptional regulator with XRE-family HTH domain